MKKGAALGHDGGFGIRVKRRDPWVRLALTAIVRKVLRLMFKVQLQDANGPFKVFEDQSG
jgi:hypothetical protein